MNSIVLLPSEKISQSEFIVTGMRADQLRERHELREGLKVAVSELHGGRGEGLVQSITADGIQFKCEFVYKELPRQKITLVIAVTRPQTVKKVLHIATTFGVVRIMFFKAENTQKSYMQSKALMRENMEHEILLGLEQAFDSRPPTVDIFKSIFELKTGLLEDINFADSCKFIADTDNYSVESGVECKRESNINVKKGHKFLAIGPEAGFTVEEVATFKDLGFEKLSLGERILRVETALAVGLGVCAMGTGEEVSPEPP